MGNKKSETNNEQLVDLIKEIKDILNDIRNK